eukprot:CAMPEP_0172700550 /NCGR_PEP_ID=MMETSP1074-20121228/30986_1 /TAXON_ID=2916 /ORGANISM="Ceratium fusus, Strain PA161109" /LENGTH=113 /DNA_ID=CAMNT_0013521945 /DNA_START=742 /DNA_END=1084 /DNA_ORIENTATION=-
MATAVNHPTSHHQIQRKIGHHSSQKRGDLAAMLTPSRKTADHAFVAKSMKADEQAQTCVTANVLQCCLCLDVSSHETGRSLNQTAEETSRVPITANQASETGVEASLENSLES